MPAAVIDQPLAPERPPTRGPSRFERSLAISATLAMGLIAGFFYAYACSVMIGLGRTDDATFINTMQSINATVRNAAFAPTFFGSLILTIAAAAVAYRRRSPRRRTLLLAAGLYAGAFVITKGISVPLNNQLAAVGSTSVISDLATVRRDYEGPWVFWNLVRTALSIGAFAALVASLRPAGNGSEQ